MTEYGEEDRIGRTGSCSTNFGPEMLLLKLARKPLFSTATGSIFRCLICEKRKRGKEVRTEFGEARVQESEEEKEGKRTSRWNVSDSRNSLKSGSPTSIGCATILFNAVCSPNLLFSTKVDPNRPVSRSSPRQWWGGCEKKGETNR